MGKSTNGGSSNAGSAREGWSRSGGGSGSGSGIVPDNESGLPLFDSGFRRALEKDGTESRIYTKEGLRALKNRSESLPTLKTVESLLSDKNTNKIHAEIKKYGYTKDQVKNELASARTRLGRYVNTRDHKVWAENPAGNKSTFLSKLLSTSDLGIDIKNYAPGF